LGNDINTKKKNLIHIKMQENKNQANNSILDYLQNNNMIPLNFIYQEKKAKND
jgi:hypothetical protein